MTAIYEALAAVMADCEEVAKRDYNEQQRFKFRGVDAVINAVGPMLRKHRVIVMPELLTVDYAPVQTSTGKPQTSCRVLVRYHFYTIDGSTISTTVAAESSDSGDKATPKAMSVAFRIALLQALALPTDSPDPDAPQTPRKQAEKKEAEPARKMSRPQRTKTPRETKESRMFALFADTGHKEKDDMLGLISRVCGREVTSRTDLTDDELDSVIAELQLEKGAME